MAEDRLRIVKIEADDFLMISHMDYVPRPGVNVFAGKNSQGKTDVLRLLRAALKGCGAEVIAHGKDKATVFVRISDAEKTLCTVKRSVTEKSTTFIVKTADGDTKASPQTFLNGLLGDVDLSLDPVAFVLKSPAEQKAYLMDCFHIGKTSKTELEPLVSPDILARLDFTRDALTVYKDAENALSTLRTEVNKQEKQKKVLLEAKLASLSPQEGPAEPVEAVSELIQAKLDEVREAKSLQRQAEGNQRLVDATKEKIKQAQARSMGIGEGLEADIASYNQEIERITGAIDELQDLLAGKMAGRDATEQRLAEKKRLQTEIASHEDTIRLVEISNVPDIASLEGELEALKTRSEKALEAQKQHQLWEEAETLKADHEAVKNRSLELTAAIMKLRVDLPTKIMREANLPFDLHFAPDDTYLNGHRLSMMSTAEQFDAILSIYHAQNKTARLKLILADRIESLDDESYAKFWTFVTENGYDAYVTKVISARVPDDAIIMEGGQIHGPQ